MQIRILFPLLALFAFFACEKDEEEIYQEQREELLEYLEANNLPYDEHPAGFFYHIVEEGGSAKPSATSSVKVLYRGMFLDGTVFDETPAGADPEPFSLRSLIPGWQIGVPLIGKGGRIILYLPSRFGYGQRGSGNSVPANSILIFEITLIDFV